MSYGMAAALQGAVFQALVADTALAGIVGTDIYDALPSGAVPSLFVALGPEVVRDRSDKTGAGAEHEFTVSVITDASGFAAAKLAAASVSDALVDAPLVLARGTLVALNFLRAKALRVGAADQRRIDLTFKALVEDD